MTVATNTTISRDAERILRVIAGEEKAFRELVDEYGGLVYNFIRRMTQNPEMADDLTQEVFVKAYRKLDSFDRARPFKPWLLRIASNTAISELRRRNRVVSITMMEEDNPVFEVQDTSEMADTARIVEEKLSSQVILQAISALDPRYRQVLLLRYKEQLSYEEIAEATGTPLNTVRTWLKRGREALRQQVRGLLEP